VNPAGAYQLDGGSDELRVRLRGAYDQPHAEAVESALREWLGGHPKPARALFFLVDLTEFSIFARTPLIRAHQALAATGCRIAHVADKPRFRGLSLLVFHLADDPAAKVFPTEALALEWLSTTASRAEDREARFHAAHARTGGPK
jgi:hypothetical protein